MYNIFFPFSPNFFPPCLISCYSIRYLFLYPRIYAASLDNLQSKVNVQRQIQATELSELSYDTIKNQVSK